MSEADETSRRAANSQKPGLADAFHRRLDQTRELVMQARRWRRRAIAGIAGSLSVLAMAPFFLWPVLFLTLPVLVWLLDAHRGDHIATDATKRMRGAAADAWWFAFGYFFFGLFWIGEAFLVEAHIFGWLLPFAITVMPAGLALFWAAAAAIAILFWRAGIERVLVLAIVLGLAEFLRGHLFTGFPWNVLGYALTMPLSLMQMSALLGIYGLTVWAVAIFATPLVALAGQQTPGVQPRGAAVTYALAAAPIVLLAAFWGYGTAVLPAGPVDNVNDVRLRLVQPSTPQHEKWIQEKQREIFDDHLALSRLNGEGRVDDMAGVTHVIWAEASMPFLPLSSQQAVQEIGQLLPNGKYLLAGALRLETPRGQTANPKPDIYSGKVEKPRVFNSLLAFGVGGGLAALYDKIHLVPFGEYLPFQRTLEDIGLQSLTRIRGGFAVGESPRRLMHVAGLPPFSPLICYEAIFPATLIQTEERPGFLLNVTNDGWFGNLTGPFQHFHQARVRAVEEGLPMVRVANNGVSAVVDPFGRVTARLGLNVKGSIDADLPVARPPTFYARHGNLMFWVSIFFFFVPITISILKQARASRT